VGEERGATVTDEELAAIRKRVEFEARVAQARDDISDALLAEVDRLRAHVAILVPALKEQAREQDILQNRVAAMRPIVEAVASIQPIQIGDYQQFLLIEPEIVEQARALLAKGAQE
jgi:hypothetical protein